MVGTLTMVAVVMLMMGEVGDSHEDMIPTGMITMMTTTSASKGND